jgi:hypothetical protein
VSALKSIRALTIRCRLRSLTADAWPKPIRRAP